MRDNLKKRIYTSIILFLILFLMFINIYIFGYILIIVGIFSLLEFYQMNLIIRKNNKIRQFLTNILFTTYILFFCSALIIFSSLLHLKIIIFLILLTCITSDIGGFVFGKILKGPKLTKISPKKTISGAIGSLIFSSIFLAATFFYITSHISPSIFITSIVISISCQIGDIFFSLLKRKSFQKDTGNILPGHGGILDRIDGILLGLPIGFLTLLFFY